MVAPVSDGIEIYFRRLSTVASGLIALSVALFSSLPVLASNLADLLRSPAYLGKRNQVVLRPGGNEMRIGRVTEVGDDYLVLEVTNASVSQSNSSDMLDAPSPRAPVIYVIPLSAILFVRPLEK